MTRRPAGRTVRLAALSCAAALGGLIVSAPAHADPLADARARASALADQVAALQQQTESATERYNLVAGRLTEAAARHGQALAQAQVARTALAAQQDVVAARARALYESGGTLTLYAQALQSDSPRVLADRIVIAQRVSASATAVGQEAQAKAAAATRSLQRAAAAAKEVAGLQRKASIASGKVAVLLERSQTLLTSADGDVTRIEAEIEQRRAAAAAASFDALLARARADAGRTAISGTAGDDIAPNPVAAAAAAAIQTRLGAPYQWGGTGPQAYDCSGLTGFAYAAAGLTLPRTAAQQYLAGLHPDLADLRRGDLLFWATDVSDPSTIHHVAMYAGGGLMWSTNRTGDTARLQEIWGADEFIGATRPDAADAALVPPPFWHGS